MTISQGFSNALSGLTAVSRMAEVVSANLANALTDGYGRRQVELSAASLSRTGGGVRIDGVARLIDRGVIADRRQAESVMAAADLTSAALARSEAAQTGVPAEAGLAGRLTALEAALISAAADPSSDLQLANLHAALLQTAEAFNAAGAAVQAERLAADKSLAADVETLNRSLRQLETLNGAITTGLARGDDVSALHDQRQLLVDGIARIVPVRELDRAGGQIALVSTGGEVLIDGRARQYGFAAVTGMAADMTLASGALSGLTRDGAPIDPARGVGLLGGGTLGAAFALRDGLLVDQAVALDQLAAELIGRFAAPGVDPSLPAGAAGLFTDAGGLPDPLDLAGLAQRLRVSALVDPAQGGALRRLRDGLDAVAGPVGAADQLNRLSGALAGATPLAQRTAETAAAAGGARLAAEEAQGFALGRWGALRQAELGQGVDSDHETQMLLRLEQAYAANARVIMSLDEMIRTLLEI